MYGRVQDKASVRLRYARAARRIKDGQYVPPKRYRPSFIGASLALHLFAFVFLSAGAASFVDSLARPGADGIDRIVVELTVAVAEAASGGRDTSRPGAGVSRPGSGAGEARPAPVRTAFGCRSTVFGSRTAHLARPAPPAVAAASEAAYPTGGLIAPFFLSPGALREALTLPLKALTGRPPLFDLALKLALPDIDGLLALTYSGGREEGVLSLTSPADGSTVEAADGLCVAVEGRAAPGVTDVRVFMDGEGRDAAVVDGKFSALFPVESEENAVYAVGLDASGAEVRSAAITFHTAGLRTAGLFVKAEYPARGGPVTLSGKWSPHPKRRDAKAPEFRFVNDPSFGAARVEDAAPGVYTIYATGAGEAVFDVRVAPKDGYAGARRKVGPLKLNGGRTTAVRVLVPEGVLWEDDAWFSGVIEAGDYTMKYRLPEGIQWREEK